MVARKKLASRTGIGVRADIAHNGQKYATAVQVRAQGACIGLRRHTTGLRSEQ